MLHLQERCGMTVGKTRLFYKRQLNSVIASGCRYQGVVQVYISKNL